MFIIKYRNLFFTISGLLILGSIALFFMYGLNPGIDFKGGAIMEVSYTGERPALADIQTSLASLPFQPVVQPAGDKDLILRARDLTNDERAATLQALSLAGKAPLTEKRFSSIGPTLGAELARKGLLAIAIVVLFIIIYIAFAFRGVSRPVASWKYGVVAIITLIHDITIPTGVFALLGHLYGVEADSLFLTALLTILALSVNDTIVIFDRIRENLKNRVSPHFADVVGQSLDETIVRSLNTSLTVIFVLLCLLFIGSEATRYFALTLAVGMFVGTYSSIFIAAPLLVVWEKWASK